MKNGYLGLFLFIGLLTGTGSAEATSDTSKLNALVKKSDLIIHGKLVHFGDAKQIKKKRIKGSRTDIDIIFNNKGKLESFRVLKGALPESDIHIVFETHRTESTLMTRWVEPSYTSPGLRHTQPEIGDRGVWFLKRKGPRYRVVDLELGNVELQVIEIRIENAREELAKAMRKLRRTSKNSPSKVKFAKVVRKQFRVLVKITRKLFEYKKGKGSATYNPMRFQKFSQSFLKDLFGKLQKEETRLELPGQLLPHTGWETPGLNLEQILGTS